MIHIPSVQELIPTDFADPKYAAIAGVIAVGAIAMDRHKQNLQHDMVSAVSFADPESADVATADLRNVNRRERTGNFMGALLLAAAALHLAGPYSTGSSADGGAAIVMSVDFAANVKDMDGGTKTRLEAEIDGATEAALQRDVPVTFILAGDTAQVTISTPSTNKDPVAIRQAINNKLGDRSFRNGSAIPDGVSQAEGLTNSGIDKIIILSASPNDHLNPSKNNDIKIAEDRTHNIYAVPTGTGEGAYTAAGQDLKSSTDVAAFSALLGAEKVQQATTTQQVTDAIGNVLNDIQIKNTETPYTGFDKVFVLAGLATALLAIRRRAAGLTFRTLPFRSRRDNASVSITKSQKRSN
jgi:hypothetical protein